MQWDDGPMAGFTTGKPWIAVNPNYPEINVAAQRDDPNSVLSFFRRLIGLRRDHPVLAQGHFTMLLPDDERIYAFTRTLDDIELVVAANFTRDPVPIAIDGLDNATLLLSNHPTGTTPNLLRPWEAWVFEALGRQRVTAPPRSNNVSGRR
jgi:oligo-1,6-glucosidase